MTQEGYAFLGLTALVAVLVSVLAFAFLRFVVGARDNPGLKHATVTLIGDPDNDRLRSVKLTAKTTSRSRLGGDKEMAVWSSSHSKRDRSCWS